MLLAPELSSSSQMITPALAPPIREVFPEAAVQRCYVRFLRNARDARLAMTTPPYAWGRSLWP